ncbi:MAG: PhzF family phenazine biosynthesis protein [Pirellula sp.]
MGIPYYHVDTFTERLFGGNPAGVCILTHFLEDAILQNIAAENALAETAFVVSRGEEFDLRWFTPTMEIDLCGHATLAPAHVLFRHLHYPGDTIVFHSRAGVLKVAREGEWLTLDFPSRPAVECAAPEGLLRAMGRMPEWVGKARDYLCVYPDAATVRALHPNMAELTELDALGVIATAPGSDGVDFVSRFFAPKAGVPEDPVTGSAHCTLIPYWGRRLSKQRMHAVQISSRRGELGCEWRGDRVGISGRCVTYSAGFLAI